MRLVLLVEKPDGLWGKTVFESVSLCLDATATSTRRQREQSMAGGAVVLNDFLCFL